MARELVIAPEALNDLDDAYVWYEEQRVGLGEEFMNCVDACIQSVVRMPELYEVVFNQYRRALVRRFPYAVYYEFVDPNVTVYAVFHTARDPAKWRRRLS